MPLNEKDKGWFIRKMFHLLFALIIFYYFFPKTIFGMPMYLFLVIIFLFMPLTIEIIRLKSNMVFLGLHEHERDHIASYVWFSIGAILLILFFPQQIAAPCIVATALGDPVIGLTKPLRRRFIVSIAFLICLAVFLIFKYILILALFGAAIAIIAESFEFKVRIRLRPNIFWSRSKKRFSYYKSFFYFLFRTDDDFIMQIIPAIVLLIIYSIFPEFLPPTLLHPLPGLNFLA